MPLPHRTKTIVINGVPTKIDAKIAYMIERISELGLKTSASCQDNYDTGYVWIQFRNSTDAGKFAGWLQSSEVDWYEWQQDHVWELGDDVETSTGCVSIRFYNKDIEKVNARLRRVFEARQVSRNN